MRVIVPLAGPDFVADDGRLKALQRIEGRALLRHMLESRPWARDVTGYAFVLFDRPETRAFAGDTLAQWYPGARMIFLSAYSQGAALSALAGLATGQDFLAPLIVDLADIFYRSTLDPAAALAADPGCGGIALSFPSQDPVYSYLRTDASGRVVEAAEKRVISAHASAGTYVFRDAPTYLRALAHAMEHAESQTCRELFFVCPLMNGVLAQGLSVRLSPVTDITDPKRQP